MAKECECAICVVRAVGLVDAVVESVDEAVVFEFCDYGDCPDRYGGEVGP